MGDEYKNAPLPSPYAPLSPRASLSPLSPRASLSPLSPLSPRSNYLKREFVRPMLVRKHAPLAPKSPKQILTNKMNTRKKIQYRHSANKKSVRSIKKSARKSFIASNAYTILGHGGEGSSTFILPYNCMVITLAHPGELTYTDKNYEYYRRMAKMDMDILLNPLQHKHELTKNFGALKIYLPGSKCPNFKYTLASIFPYKNQEKKPVNEADYRETLYEAFIPGSGVVTIQSLQKEVRLHRSYEQPYATKKKIDAYKAKDIYDEILSHYNKSLFPTQEIIQKNLDSMQLEKRDPEKPYLNYIDALKMIYNSPTIVSTQKKLINELPPGVYYNFACRSISRIHDVLYEKNEHGTKILHMKTIPQLKAKYRETGENKYKKTINVLGERIGNFSRKELARNYYTSNRFKKNEISKYYRLIGNSESNIQEIESELEDLGAGMEESKEMLENAEGNEYNEYQKQVADYNSNIQRATKALQKAQHNIERYGKEQESLTRRSVKKSAKKRRHSAH